MARQIYSIAGAILQALPCCYQNDSKSLKSPLMRFFGEINNKRFFLVNNVSALFCMQIILCAIF